MYTKDVCTDENVTCFMIVAVLSFTHISQVTDWLYRGSTWWDGKIDFAFEASNHNLVCLSKLKAANIFFPRYAYVNILQLMYMYINNFCTDENVICFVIVAVLSFTHISQVIDWLYTGSTWWDGKIGFAFEASNHNLV